MSIFRISCCAPDRDASLSQERPIADTVDRELEETIRSKFKEIGLIYRAMELNQDFEKFFSGER